MTFVVQRDRNDWFTALIPPVDRLNRATRCFAAMHQVEGDLLKLSLQGKGREISAGWNREKRKVAPHREHRSHDPLRRPHEPVIVPRAMR